MSRNLVLAAGALCWLVVGFVAFDRLLKGDSLATALMAFVFVVWIVARRDSLVPRRVLKGSEVRVED